MQSIKQLSKKLSLISSHNVEITDNDQELINRDVDKLISRLLLCNNIDEAESLLNDLGTLQEVLAKLAFQYHITLHPRLMKLVREFDRSDDNDVRLDVFNKIKNRKFLI